MSDKPDIEAIKATLAAATPGPWELVDFPVMFPRVQSIAEDKSNICETWGWADAKFIADAPANIAALLAEVERLQRERSEWCDRADVLMTEHMTQLRDLTAENAKLRARLVVDDAMVERATFAWLGTAWVRGVVESDPQMAADVRRWQRTALEAALNG
jgi:acetyl-CoA carboxylase carboxyltransferase component